MNIFAILFFYFVCISFVSASEPSQVGAELISQSTSDGFDSLAQKLYYRNHRRDISWPYPGAAQQALDIGLSAVTVQGQNTNQKYSGEQIEILSAFKWSPHLMILGSAGNHTFRLKNLEGTNFFSYGGGIQMAEDGKYNIEVAYRRDLSYREVQQSELTSEPLSGKTARAATDWNLYSQVKLRARGDTTWLSDDNRKSSSEVQLLYGFFRSEIWWWAGVSGEWLAFENSETSYWSPLRFYSYGLHSELALPLFGRLSLNNTVKISRGKEEDFSPSNGGYLSVGLLYGIRDHWQAKLGYDKIRTNQEASTWQSDGFSANFNASF